MSTREPCGAGRSPRRDRRIITWSPDELLRVFLALECAVSGAEGVIVRGRRPAKAAPLAFLLVHRPGVYVTWPSLPRAAGTVLTEVTEPIAADRIDAWLRAVSDGRDAPADRLFRVCYFAVVPAGQDTRAVVKREGQFMLAVGGEIVARARTLRSNPEGAEVWVETAVDYRRRGYGRRVAAAWGREQLSQGRAGFYCYALGNLASARLAKSLGLPVLADGLWC